MKGGWLFLPTPKDGAPSLYFDEELKNTDKEIFKEEKAISKYAQSLTNDIFKVTKIEMFKLYMNNEDFLDTKLVGANRAINSGF